MNLLNMSSGFTIFGFEIKYYGIAMALSYVLALIICVVLCKKKGYGSNLPYKLLLIAFPLAVIGGRLGYVLFYESDWTLSNIINIRSGGLMLYGGVFLAGVGILVYALCHKQNVVRYFDLIAPCLVIAQALGRWGNFFNQEAYGVEVTNSALQWFPFAVFIEADGAWHLATFFYESLWCFITFFVVYKVFLKSNRIGMSTCTYLLMYGMERFLVEGMRTDSLYIGSVRVSQLISALMVGVALGYFIYVIISKHVDKKHPVAYDATSQQLDMASIALTENKFKTLETQLEPVQQEQFDEALAKQQLKQLKKQEKLEKKKQQKEQKLAEKQARQQLKNQKLEQISKPEPIKQEQPATNELTETKVESKIEQSASKDKTSKKSMEKDSIIEYMKKQREDRQKQIKENDDYDPDFSFAGLDDEEDRKTINIIRMQKIKEQLNKQIKDKREQKNKEPLT